MLLKIEVAALRWPAISTSTVGSEWRDYNSRPTVSLASVIAATDWGREFFSEHDRERRPRREDLCDGLELI